MSQILIPGGEARAIHFKAGTRFKVVDVEGGQVCDLFAFNADDLSEYASASHTRSIVKKIFPICGDSIYTDRRRAILELETDLSPGRHDSLIAACDPEMYDNAGVPSGHRSCARNLAEAMADFGGLGMPTPQPFNLFMEVSTDSQEKISVTPATSNPGDYLIFRTCIDIILVCSACPFDIYSISTGGISPILVESM